MTWANLTPIEKREAVRELIETNSRTYLQAATALKVTPNIIAGVIDRAKRARQPIKTTSGFDFSDNRGRIPKIKKVKSPPTPVNANAIARKRSTAKKKHTGLTAYIALPAVTVAPVTADPGGMVTAVRLDPGRDHGPHQRLPLPDRPGATAGGAILQPGAGRRETLLRGSLSAGVQRATGQDQSKGNRMSERAYTVAEIDALRQVCGDRWLWGTTYWGTEGGTRYSHSYKESDRVQGTEELVRTYMLAGIVAADILREDREKAEQYQKMRAEALAKATDAPR